MRTYVLKPFRHMRQLNPKQEHRRLTFTRTNTTYIAEEIHRTVSYDPQAQGRREWIITGTWRVMEGAQTFGEVTSKAYSTESAAALEFRYIQETRLEVSRFLTSRGL